MSSCSNCKKAQLYSENICHTVDTIKDSLDGLVFRAQQAIENNKSCAPVKELKKCNEEVEKFYKDFEMGWGNFPEVLKDEYLTHCQKLGSIDHKESSLIERIKWMGRIGQLWLKSLEPAKDETSQMEEGRDDDGLRKKIMKTGD